MIAFSNSRSGGGKGAVVIERLAKILGEAAVFDLGSNPHPEEVLARPEFVAAAETGLRVIVCGGDGTMTWIMASVDGVRERLGLDATRHEVMVSMMPLGTGNDLSRTFGWGGKFRSACTKASWVAAVEKAEPTRLDRWLVSVMPSSRQQEGSAETKVPEVFSIHEFDTTVFTEPRHSVVSRGLHHLDTVTDLSRAHLELHEAEMRSDQFEADFAPVDLEKTESDKSETSFGDRGDKLLQAHAVPSESVLGQGATWRSYDGTFSNYFSFGVDAAGAFAFHKARRENPKRFSSRLKNQALYAWLGALATGGVCCCDGPPPRLAPITTLLCKDVEGAPPESESESENDDAPPGWRRVRLPKRCRGIIVLNLRSYAGGRDLWGPPSRCRDCCDRRSFSGTPTVDDGILEVVTCDSIFDLAASLVTANGLGGRARRLVRATELRIKLASDVFMQIDGEPWHQPAATVHIKSFGQSTVLRNTSKKSCC
ncbi:hypothetical protein CTAYLR_008738 [Chrysophaeum taylorii]|uniref:Diacylglycerol kinase n=1 Tax=Chrysophaeum taylorii TaxID=2483200 RepID=A0AAD7ULK9_9STRA|nr:hypothetical protein CTAYLR_008738 [Chrysophaeum taylorii]